MSNPKRKIGHYIIEFKRYRARISNNGENLLFFDKNIFRNLLNYINSLPEDNKIIRNEITKKAVSIETCQLDEPEQDIVRIIFKSCKYNHCPNYMSADNGSERPSDKLPNEGEKEKTHLCARITPTQVNLILELRKNGVTMTQIINYLNDKLKIYYNQVLKKTLRFKLHYSIIPSGDFIKNIQSSSRIKCAEIYTSKTLLGSETLNLMEREDSEIQDDVIITVKAKPKQSIKTRIIKKAYNFINNSNSNINRIKVDAINNEGNPIKIDTNSIIRTDFILATLDQNGIVDSPSFLISMVELLLQRE